MFELFEKAFNRNEIAESPNALREKRESVNQSKRGAQKGEKRDKNFCVKKLRPFPKSVNGITPSCGRGALNI